MSKSTGFILNGKYYKAGTAEALEMMARSSTFKEWDKDDQRRKHRRDLIQPYKNGRPNEDFIAHYPEEAKNYGFIKGGDK